jgi:hypothetical protein
LTQPDPNANEYIAEYQNPYALRGGDQTGKCFNIKTSLTKPVTTDSSAKYTVGTFNYFDDPILSMDDSTLIGCHLDMTYDELSTFCTQKGF